ncbi:MULTISPECIES: DUF4365 domain-containing protein [Rhizobium]|uniref:DUF4365 domain-containing protein n=1 Tax=Rhizobium TaxID=379 RepID=UPI00067EF2ED|nr:MULTISPECIES: DUF4365 domain-containing protein [Rhizobium]MBB3298099.1 hypothetical protein [Rhizobium sp. BK112]MBB3366596.1 hypothetical protein [Rhizobium sp. BK077]MBB4177407.1 hypothetical protein [Rhizobium sp. BK109]
MSSTSLKRPYSDITARQEAYSGAYIQAVAAVAGCSIASPKPDNDKIDWWVSSRVRGTTFTKPQIHIQAKCFLNAAAKGEHTSYTLDIDTYDNLRDERVSSPRILVVVLVPNDFPDWLLQDEAQLALRHCAYWVSLKGAPEILNQATRTVHLPRTNIFSPRTLQAMMVRASNGEDLAGVTDAEELA